MRYILIILAIFYTSCSKISNGTIISKWHEPGHGETIIMPSTMYMGKNPIIVYIPFYVYDSEDWCVMINGINSKGDSIMKTYYVDKVAYDTLYIGDFLCIDSFCDEDRNNLKTKQK